MSNEAPAVSLATDALDSRFPSIEHLRERARRRIPRFAFEYLEGGCNSEVNLRRNTDEIREIQLKPWYLRDYPGSDQRTELFGTEPTLPPSGCRRSGCKGWSGRGRRRSLRRRRTLTTCRSSSCTVGTASIETVAEITEGGAWFQLYHPAEDELRDKLLERASSAGLEVLVILADTPTFAYRPKEIKNGLSIPPKMSVRNVIQMMLHPTWSFSQLAAGAPEFKTMAPYIPKGLSMKHLGLFMNKTFSGRLTADKIAAIRERWKGKLVVKGIVNGEDAAKAIGLGVDGIIVSNHGGRQLDAGQSTIRPLIALAEEFGDRTTLMIDSGLRSGSDIACALASGAKFTFMGRSFMYGVGLGKNGGLHTITMLKRQLQQVMEQLGCATVEDFPKHRLP